jgi:magnesium-protoporphyrin IX monomethyl ester (oxidative) cyclase
MRSAQNVLAEVAYLKKRYGVRHFEFVDDNFTIAKDRTIEICRELEKMKVTWRPSSGAYVPSLDKEVLTWMKKSGCNFLTIAIENGNQDVLKNIIGKNVDLERVKEILKICKELNIWTEGFFILGLAGETKQNIINTIKYAIECGVDAARLYIAVPFYGTRLYNECVKNNYLTKDYDFSRLIVGVAGDVKTAVIKTKQFTPEDVMKLRKIGLKAIEEKNFEKYKAELEAV